MRRAQVRLKRVVLTCCLYCHSVWLLQLKEGTRLRVLLPAFLKACRDPFPHARLAGLKAASACSQYFGEPVTIATKIIPTIAASLVGLSQSVHRLLTWTTHAQVGVHKGSRIYTRAMGVSTE